jgi:DNA-binding GntR family transcriptional regulator
MPPTPRKAPRREPHRKAPVDPVERTDNISLAYQEIRRRIVWGQLPPGSRISERTVAELMGLSRTPVRSALHRLEQEGFVAAYGDGHDRRLIVAPLTMHDGQEVFYIIGHLEGLAARSAAQLPKHQRDALVRQLRDLNDKLTLQSRNNADALRFFELDIDFHSSYVEGIAGPRLLALHRAIKPQGERYIRLYVSVFLGEVSTSVREHAKIIGAIARGDADGAQKAVETNWHNAAERLAHVIARHGERGSWHTWGAPEAGAAPAARRRKRRDTARYASV